MKRFLVCLLVCLSAICQAEEVTIRWTAPAGADNFMIRKGGCDGEVVHYSPETTYVGEIENVSEYCMYSMNNHRVSEPYTVTVDPKAPSPDSIDGVTITVNVDVTVGVSSGQ